MGVDRGARWSPAATFGALACALVAAPAALAAPPVISSADADDVWSVPPVYTVTGEADARFTWTGSDIRAGQSATSPFTVQWPEDVRDGRHFVLVIQNPDEGRTETATRTFVVDRTAPAALTVAGPAAVTAGQPAAFTWTGGEPGARFVWRVDGPAGQIQGPVETTTPAASPAPLQPGAYTLVARQVDVAGNAGPDVAAAFSVVTPPPAAAPPPPPAAPAALAPPTPLSTRVLPLPRDPVMARIKLPSTNPGRLKPRRAAMVGSRRPILRWKRGPRGTSLYNVQIFRVDTSRMASSNSVRLRKLRSVFPRSNRMRTPQLKRGACYVWRVWPYRRADFTTKPLGVSNFCVAKRAPARRARR